jgi:two-component system sensor histidine kinase UhpB
VNLALRILFVAVSSTDAGSVVRALETAGYAPAALMLPDLAAVPGALAAGPWDAVISAERTPALAPAQAIDAGELQAALAGQRRDMRALSVRLTEVEENARRRLSAELHDRVGQSLVTLGLTLSLVRYQLASSGADSLVARIDEAQRVTDEMSTQVRDVMVELRPPVLDDFGLLAALRSHAARFAATTGLAAEVLGEELSPRLPLIVETALFRVAQEALTNVIRHAHARRVTLTLEAMPEGVRLTLADDGQGFSPQRPRGLGEKPRWGLLTMRERIETVGGTMRIASAPGQGTSIILEVAR